MNNNINSTINSTLAMTAHGVTATISDVERSLRITFIIVAVIYILVMVVAIPGNLLITWITLVNKAMRSPTNLLVCNLAVAGLVMACIQMPIKTYELIFPIRTLFHYSFGVNVCKMAQFVPAVCILSISITLTTICIDRYISIIYPTKRNLRMNLFKVYIFLPCCWFISFVFSTPHGTFMNVRTFGSLFKRCTQTWPKYSHLDFNITNSHHQSIYYLEFSRFIVWIVFIVVVFLLPAIIMSILYAIIAKKLWQKGPGYNHNVVWHSTNGRSTIARKRDISIPDSPGLKAKRRVSKVLITCLALFVLTNLPYYCVFIIIDFRIVSIQDSYLVYRIINVLIILSYTCIAYNAIIYGYLNKAYRANAPLWLRYIVRACSSARIESAPLS